MDIMVKINDTIHRAKYWLDVDHPSGEWVMVEFYLPVNGFKTQWVKTTNIRPAYFMQLLWDETIAQRSCISAEFLKQYHFHIPANTPIDIWGFCYLNDDQQRAFWQKFGGKLK